jgi:hypothetical protein
VKSAAAAALAVATMVFAACTDTTGSAPKLATDALVNQDIASSAGDAAAQLLFDMQVNESSAGAPMITSADQTGADITPNFTYVRTRTCYDAQGAVVASCSPISSVRKIVTHVTANGSRSGTTTTTGGGTVTMTGAVHRTADDTLTRVFTSTTETSRVHNGNSLAKDTTTFSGNDVTRLSAETATDSVQGVTWAIPRTQGASPTAGKIIRRATVHITVTKANLTETRDVTRRIEIDFPADANGNVVLKIDNKTCSLNLQSHAVTNCS